MPDMKERPIIFTGESVRAILDGHKTQTRRVIKPQPESSHTGNGCWSWGKFAESLPATDIRNLMMERCPYGQPGDRLWVRETWQGWVGCQAVSDDWDVWTPNPTKLRPDSITYRANGHSSPERWHSSIHMPRWASRLTLEIVKVRVERVKDISEDDAWAEGVSDCIGPLDIDGRVLFGSLWNKINARRGFGLDVNPWVWVIEFRRIQ